MITQIWSWLNGYLIIKLKGQDIEILLNRIASEGLGLWDIQRVAPHIVIGKIRIKQFRKLRPLLISLNLSVSVVGKRGFPFAINKIMKRQALIIGLLIFLGGLFYLSDFIWFINITGLEKVDQAQVLEVISDVGVKSGIKKTQFKPREIESTLLIQIPEISWVGVSIRGTRAQIQVVERTSPDLSEIQYGDIVASKDGLITQILAFKGTAVAKIGDTVKKGDLLIAGNQYDKYGKIEPIRAEGLVSARVWKDAIGEAAFTKIRTISTGNQHTNYTLKLGRSSVRLGKKVPFTDYLVDTVSWQQQVKEYIIPVSLKKHTFEEVNYEALIRSKNETYSLALERAWDQLNEAGIYQEQVSELQIAEYQVEDQEGIRIGLIVELEQNIGEFAPDI